MKIMKYMTNQKKALFLSPLCSMLLWLVCIFVLLAPDARAEKDDELSIVCYNVRRCRTDAGKYDYNHFADIIRKCRPDYVSLQELVNQSKQSTGEELAKRLGMHFSFGAAIPLGDGEYGVGILSKEKPMDVKKITIPSESENRLLLIAEFKDCYFAATHFPLTPEERAKAVSIVIEATLALKDKPVILTGDFNAEPEGDTVKSLLIHYKALSSLKSPTYPAKKPKKVIDYIFASKKNFEYEVLESKVIATQDKASDHLPLSVKVKFTK